eukprot:CAMPEP_0198153746 /NCGR_PEP_ID=MMETSP1443-20131203/65571_1 /TAXON_ID=186043 /ORGANISM="Entomoneis sp., Strain CCMP2396" /LENGTH=282 /DNA_ID=CAMNT_0043820191 /DNA_START=176 /DNA_END=1024 /DNA_ORIENTATION=-
MPEAVLELEQKFAVTSSTVQRLQQLGFEQIKELSMVDWYFDFAGYPLIQRDTWLRYRHLLLPDDNNNNNSDIEGGQWELKLGQRGMNQQQQTSKEQQKTTVYKELAGEDVFLSIQNMHLSVSDATDAAARTGEVAAAIRAEFEGLAIPRPQWKISAPLIPLARIVTHRSSWRKKSSSSFDDPSTLSVDLDQTDFGYNVGEAEIVVPMERGQDKLPTESSKVVENAKVLIQDLIDQLTATDSHGQESPSIRNAGPAKGKLEYFLYHEKPQIYKVLQEAGLVPS